MASTYLTRTPSSSGNRKTWTLSMWVKRSNDNYSQLSGTGTGSTYFIIGFGDTQPRILQSANAGEAVSVQINNKCRDVNGYYHLVFRVDTTQATASNRIRMYINGEEGTYSETDYPSQNLDMYYNYNIVHGIGARGDGDSKFDGAMSHIHFCDGYSYDASSFGSTDSTTGEWKINTDPSVSYGTNGFTILKDGNTVTDQSTNSNNWTVAAGTLTKTEDCPSNVFATMNPLVPTSSLNFSNGNTTLTGTNATNYSSNNTSTLGASSGKYYFEIEYDTAGSNTSPSVGISLISIFPTTNPTGSVSDLVVITMENQIYVEGTNSASYLGSTPSTGDIIQIALDMDNGKVFFGLNGTFVGDPVAGSGSAFSGITSGETIALNIRPLNAVFKCNFGNGYFGTTAVSSAGTNASNNGIFEYDVPTGYTALSTKGLNL